MVNVCVPNWQVRSAFSWCEIVGKRFPICHVHLDETIVEVCYFFFGFELFYLLMVSIVH